VTLAKRRMQILELIANNPKSTRKSVPCTLGYSTQALLKSGNVQKNKIASYFTTVIKTRQMTKATLIAGPFGHIFPAIKFPLFLATINSSKPAAIQLNQALEEHQSGTLLPHLQKLRSTEKLMKTKQHHYSGTHSQFPPNKIHLTCSTQCTCNIAP